MGAIYVRLGGDFAELNSHSGNEADHPFPAEAEHHRAKRRWLSDFFREMFDFLKINHPERSRARRLHAKMGVRGGGGPSLAPPRHWRGLCGCRGQNEMVALLLQWGRNLSVTGMVARNASNLGFIEASMFPAGRRQTYSCAYHLTGICVPPIPGPE